MKLSLILDQPVVKKHLIILVIGIGIGLLSFFYINSSLDNDYLKADPLSISLSLIFAIVATYLIFYSSKKLDGLLSWKTQLTTRFVAGIAIGFLIVFSLAYLFVYFFNTSHGETNEDYTISPILIKLAIIAFILVLIYNILYFAFYSYLFYAKTQIDKIAYEHRQIELQLKALKSQLSSHFLFNNLNTISYLVNKDESSAVDYVRGLAFIYEYILNSYNIKLIDFKDELKFAKAYYNLLKKRYGDALSCNFKIDHNCVDSKLPPLTLQMLLENAVKHNQVDNENPLKINVDCDSKFIIVKNNITEPIHRTTSFHLGLDNIKKRYELHFQKSVAITKDVNFEVKLPIVK